MVLHKWKVFTVLIGFWAHVQATEMPATVIFNNNNTVSSNSLAESASIATQTLQATFTQLSSVLVEYKDRYSGFFYSIGFSLFEHRSFFAALGVVSLYAYAVYYALKAHSYLSNDHLWSRWKEEIAMQELLIEQRAIIANDLVLDLQRRYTFAENPTDFLTPFVYFMQDIEDELAMLQHYQKIEKALQKIRIRSFIPYYQTVFVTIQEKIERLLYVKNIFLTWAAEFKLATHEKPFREDKQLAHESSC